ncbi:probable signal peptidase complex subunit 2 [Tanacetum coccineum]
MMNWKCNWDGVTCDYYTGDVIELDLRCGMLQGTLHPNTSFFNLPQLGLLDLAFNQLNGTLPPGLFTSPSLISISLDHNMFSGRVPFESFDLPSLKFIDLRNNHGEWELDTSLSSLTNLESLDLSYSGFSVTTSNNANHYVNPSFTNLRLASCKLKGRLEVSNPSMFMLYENILKKLKQRRALSNSSKGVTALEANIFAWGVGKTWGYSGNSRLQARQAIGLDKKHQYEGSRTLAHAVSISLLDFLSPLFCQVSNPSIQFMLYETLLKKLKQHRALSNSNKGVTALEAIKTSGKTSHQVVASRGYSEDVTTSNIRLLIGAVIIIIALFAQFYNKKFPENKNYLIALFNGILQLIVYTKEKNAILFTYPPAGSAYNSTGLMISSKLPRFSDKYTLAIASADPKSISAKPTVEFTKSVTKWSLSHTLHQFTKDGVLVEGLFWKDVEGLVNDYNKESKKISQSQFPARYKARLDVE